MDILTIGGILMEQTTSPELLEFKDLITAIRAQSALLKQVIISEAEVKIENDILSEFDSAIQAQIFSTLTNLVLYQLRGWRELIDE